MMMMMIFTGRDMILHSDTSLSKFLQTWARGTIILSCFRRFFRLNARCSARILRQEDFVVSVVPGLLRYSMLSGSDYQPTGTEHSVVRCPVDKCSVKNRGLLASKSEILRRGG